MRGRTSKLVLAAGALVVVALVIGLVQLTRGDAQAEAVPVAARSAPRAQIAEAPAPPPVSAREEAPQSTAPRRQVSMPARRPELAPPPLSLSFTRDLKRDANGKLVPVFPVQHLREQIHRLDAPMQACVERAGQGVTGKATLSFTVSAKNNKLFIETTGVQDEETLAAYPDLLDCMHQTATAFAGSLEGRPVPELGTGIYVRRHVRLENGALAENSIFNFSYNP